MLVYRNGTHRKAARRPVDAPAPTVHFGARSNTVEWIDADLAYDQSVRGKRVTVEQATILQGFPADHPWSGSATKQYEQVGNAVPPPLAEAILRALVCP